MDGKKPSRTGLINYSANTFFGGNGYSSVGSEVVLHPEVYSFERRLICQSTGKNPKV